ncbi:DMT family transporter [Alkalicoccus daliensis]|uniref:Putative multidrug resistance efflux transporter n=1 Tax=Alkalicoccus daliensis TaxID=745820 RepID=A0A1H0HGR8_9BACI|nr:multidrug resistance efflux transporter family protein [Alkalicoccus daliensis]SDO18362.1 Putative multidrug resistance efflux transporter [Alkalicoccus daliensis]
MKEIGIGIAASMFFAVTFILNRAMELDGGSWMWSSSLRFYFMIPFLLLILLFSKNLKQVFVEIAKRPYTWMLWSTVGFGLFYAPLTYAAAYGPGWLIAGTWQLTIVAGVLLSPFFFHIADTPEGQMKIRHKIPGKALFISLMIFSGVLLIQFQQAEGISLHMLSAGVLPVVIAAFAYPLGNRKMMEVCGERLNTFQRILGMIICSLPLWLIISTAGFIQAGPPSGSQLLQTLIVGICSGVIATSLFFIATNSVRGDIGRLAAVEATQSMTVIFVLLGEIVLLATPLPSGSAIGGLMLIIAGMIIHSLPSHNKIVRKAA